jgi:hypothetical protein
MAIQKEPGQKGVSWSNIAVGMCALFTLLDPRWTNSRDRCNHEHGIIV